MKKIIFLFILLLTTNIVYGSITPQGDTNYRDTYSLFNVKNITVWSGGDVCIDTGNCLSDIVGLPGDQWPINGPYLYNNSGTLDFNESYLNQTVNSNGFFTSITNFTGTLTDSKYCIYTSGIGIVCNSDSGSITETDPIWTSEKENYYNKTEVESLPISTFTNDIGYFVPGTDNLNMNDYNITNIGVLGFNLSSCTDTSLLNTGEMCFDNESDTISLMTNSGQVIQFGREMGENGINRQGTTVADGSVVYISGSSGDHPEFKLADGSNVSKSSMVGIVTITCLANELCPVTVFGFVNGIDTSMWNTGDKLYNNPSEPGNLTNIIPTLPNNPEWIATALNSKINGRILVNPKIDPSDGFLINTIYASGNIYENGQLLNETYSLINEPLSLHLNQDNFNTDDYILYNGVTYSFSFNQSKLENQFFNVTSISTVAGTPSGGLTEINIYNGDSYNVTEITSNPGLDVRFNFSGVDEFTELVIRYKTDTSENHLTQIQMWDYDDSEWENYGSASAVEDYTIFSFPVFDDESHINGGIVQVRVVSNEIGNINHKHYFDWITLIKGFGVPTGGEIDPIWNSEKENYYNKTEVESLPISTFTNDEGYLTSYTETDPIFVASDAYDITSSNISDWNTAYSWGDHSVEGYLTSYTETDPIFVASDAYDITSSNISDWNTAYSWGDHSVEGYLTSSPFGSSIDDTELTAENFGDFTCTGVEDGCTINTGALSIGTEVSSSVNVNVDMNNNNVTEVSCITFNNGAVLCGI